MHLIINCDPAAAKGLQAFEEAVCSTGSNPHSLHEAECGTLRLARTSASAFTARGSQTAGVPVMWDMFLRGKAVKNTLLTFNGHRTNIGFHNCASVYFHQSSIQEFLKDWPDKNKLLLSITYDIRQTLYLAGCR